MSVKIEKGYIQFTPKDISDAWEELNPHDGPRGALKEDPYKQETLETLSNRKWVGKTNFDNIGGNIETRVTKDNEPLFVDASWITPYFIATGYPTNGLMRENYWKMVDTLQKTHTVFIVNLMNERDAKDHGGWFFDDTRMKGENYFTTELDRNGQKIYVYHYPYWPDGASANIGIVLELIKAVDEAKKLVENAVIIGNCRAGVGRTGVFANLLHFYKRFREAEELPEKEDVMEEIHENIDAFRYRRGDQQFVQTEAQFNMLCRGVEILFNEEVDRRSNIG
jgi:protein tyrosine phosphatase